FTASKFRVSPSESLVIYTDGISEAESPDGSQFGAASIEKLLAGCRELHSHELVDKCLKEVLRFRGGSPKLDDQALMVLQFAPGAAA
ncbi:MAG TPA: SpoIIE family protein phosphatase, partial [Candidatus Sulfotelmatobacter sp.]|nr:SpoIIE family protein phosphatase [Candidatus Sulfotelmatobacter sp.]